VCAIFIAHTILVERATTFSTTNFDALRFDERAFRACSSRFLDRPRQRCAARELSSLVESQRRFAITPRRRGSNLSSDLLFDLHFFALALRDPTVASCTPNVRVRPTAQLRGDG
jgi:hypothetical protein